MIGKTVICILFVLVTASSQYARTSSCDAAEKFLKTANKQDKTKLESINILADAFRSGAKWQSVECVDELFVSFRTFYYDSLWQNEIPETVEDVVKMNSKLKRVGWRLRESEGDYYIGEDGSWLLSEFGKYLSPSWIAYLARREIEIEEGFSDDASLAISWEDLRERITFWESLQNKNPEFSINKEISSDINMYVKTMLTGLDNTSIESDSVLKEEVRVIYERFLIQNKDSRYHTIVKGYYEVLKKNGFRVNSEAARFLERNEVDGMLSIKPPTY